MKDPRIVQALAEAKAVAAVHETQLRTKYEALFRTNIDKIDRALLFGALLNFANGNRSISLVNIINCAAFVLAADWEFAEVSRRCWESTRDTRAKECYVHLVGGWYEDTQDSRFLNVLIDFIEDESEADNIRQLSFWSTLTLEERVLNGLHSWNLVIIPRS